MKWKETRMPAQETFLDQQIGDKRIEVIKTYDTRQARDAFDEMDEASHAFLWNALSVFATYEESELPEMNTAEGADFLWEELLQESREDGNVLSFFLTFETTANERKPRFVAPDWPIAEQYATTVLSKREIQ
jgi:hypothetical protein